MVFFFFFYHNGLNGFNVVAATMEVWVVGSNGEEIRVCNNGKDLCNIISGFSLFKK